LQLPTYVMLTMLSFVALTRIRHATLKTFSIVFSLHLRTYVMTLQRSSVAIAHARHATLETSSVAPAHTYMMLHYKRLLLNLRTLAPSTCVKTCWRRQRRQYARRCMTKRSQFQTVGVGKWTMGTLCSWPNSKKSFQRKKTMELTNNQTTKTIKVRRNLKVDRLPILHLVENNHAAMRGFRHVSLFMIFFMQISLCWSARGVSRWMFIQHELGLHEENSFCIWWARGFQNRTGELAYGRIWPTGEGKLKTEKICLPVWWGEERKGTHQALSNLVKPRFWKLQDAPGKMTNLNI